MENKLQELTRKLYDEGLSKGKEEAERLVENARKEARQIVKEAEAQAERTVQEAEQRAEEMRKNAMTELALAGRQTIGTLKQQIEKLIVLKGVAPAVKAANADPEFVKQMLLQVASNWNAGSSERIDLKAVLPAQTQETFRKTIEDAARTALGEGLEISFDGKARSGFRIGPKEGGYYISFSDADFDALLKEYLRPQLTKMLFAEE